MSKVDQVHDFMRDLRRSIRDLESVINTIEDSVTDLQNINITDVINSVDDDVMAEALVAGLPLIEARYGLSSKESKDIREYVAALTKR